MPRKVVAVVVVAAAVVPCAQEARPGSQGSSTYWATCFYPYWCLASYVCCHVPTDHTDYGDFTRGTYARSRIPWGETLRTTGVSGPHTRAGRGCPGHQSLRHVWE